MEEQRLDQNSWAPADEIPFDKPNAARIYDYLLGGFHNFAVDRAVAEQMISIYPDAIPGAQVNRAFLRRAVGFVIEQGIDQILDLGSGIPTVGNVHQVAQAANPEARVVYVDIDPVAVRHSLAMLQGNPRATAIQADVRQPQAILDHPEVRRLLDFDRPLAVLMIAVLHYVVDDEEVYGVVRTIRGALAPGSYVTVCHGTTEFLPAERARVGKVFRQASAVKSRSRSEIERFFDGLELVAPGVVATPLWRPEGPDDILLDQPDRGLTLAGVGRVPAE